MYFDEQTKDALCFGYWQSEEYFKPEADALRKQLIFKKPLTNQTVAVAESIMRGNNATFVHIRRGDYVTNLKANQHHGVCDKTYYQRSVEHVRQRVSGPQFFVFSDDLDWVKQELGDLFPAATFVNHNKGADSWQDMYLMSLCRHAIVANSSFSWWGAWLNPVTDRVVTAPRQWFANQSPSNERIAPSFWTRL
ncbi:alpha-1,2-fucosyltransferase [Spirosoma knui]